MKSQSICTGHWCDPVEELESPRPSFLVVQLWSIRAASGTQRKVRVTVDEDAQH